MGGSVIAVEKSQNHKTGPVSATYVSQATCPTACPFYRNGCYAESGPIGIVTNRLNKSRQRDITKIAQEEANAIDALSAARPLRVHVVGDSPTHNAASLVGAAMVRYANRGRTFAWTYTHAWRRVASAAWRGAAVLASCESPSQVRQALRRGYAACIVVDTHPNGRKSYPLDGGGDLTVIPCPREFGGKPCSECGLCAKPGLLKQRGYVVGFAAHGSRSRRVKESAWQPTSLPLA